MKLALIAAAAFLALATPALAEEEWLITGGDGSAFGYDRTSIKKEGQVVSLRFGVYSSTPIPAPPELPGAMVFGLSGVLAVNCQDKSFKSGEATYYLSGNGEKTVPASAAAKFEKPKAANDYRQYFLGVACQGARTLDVYPALGRKSAVATMKTVADRGHVTNTAGKGWAFAIADAGRVLAVDTSSTKRVGDSVLQPEIVWMRKPQSTNGQAWRYYFLITEYDCAKGRRRGNGPFRIYNDADMPVHEETVADAPWEPVAGPQGQALLEMACKNKKLTGLPSGGRGPMLSRLKELGALQ